MKTRRISRTLTPAQHARLQRQRRAVGRELPELIIGDQMRKEARDEATLSGELRRAIHASAQPLSEIAANAGVPAIALDEFLTGERTLRSDTLDRLAAGLGLSLTVRM